MPVRDCFGISKEVGRIRLPRALRRGNGRSVVISEILEYTTTGIVTVPVSYITFRAFQFRNTIQRGKEMHAFTPHIRRDMHMGRVTMKWCDVCRQGRKAWIHTHSSGHGEEPIGEPNRLHELEREDTKWRFENDPDWVKVFGHEFDPDTFERIPQFHNGECGGPHDSCERCNWEKDQEERKAKAERKKIEAKSYTEKRNSQDQRNVKYKESVTHYLNELWTIWNTVHEPADALEAFEELNDDLGMEKNQAVTREVKSNSAWKRINFCIHHKDADTVWRRRMEAWDVEIRRQQSYSRSRYDYY